MDIVRSLELESFILTKLTKPLVRVNLVGPQVSFRNGAPQMSGRGIIFGRVKLELFIMTKLTKPLVRSNLVGPQVSLRNGAPQMSEGGIIFWAAEAKNIRD